ncbi:hypothetical protein BDV93DRAFT_522491 [Ceratobasidium sp. AG-I]|nr:hypothetical protein BDV93DRAFT_522491 [Ceratobasidium sp. AG-I]
MSAPTLQPLDISAPLGTPAAEWAQQTVEAIDPNASTGVVTDAHGNPTTNHAASALSGAPGGGLNADKKAAHLDAIASHAPGGVGATSEPPSTGLVTDAHGNPTGVHSASAYDGAPGPGVNSNKTVQQLDAVSANAPKATAPIPLQTEPAPVERPVGVFTDAHGNPTTNPNASAFPSGPGADSPSVASTPGVQLPGGWIRSAGSRQQSMSAPQTTLYEDVSSALGTVGQAAFSALPASVIGNLSHNTEQGGANPQPQNGTTHTPAAISEDAKITPPARSGSPGLLSRAQGMLSGLLARPASPAPKLPVPDAPTTTGTGESNSENPALVGGGAVAQTANAVGDNIAAGQDLGGHEPKGVLEGDRNDSSSNTNANAALVGGGAVAQTANAIGDQVASGQNLGGHEPKGVLDGDRNRLAALGLDKVFNRERMGDGETSATSPAVPNTAAMFLDAGIPTPDPNQPSHDPGLSGSVFPVLADDPKKSKAKVASPGTGKSPSSPKSAGMGSSLSPDLDVQNAARNSNQDFTTPIPQAGGGSDEPDRPSVTKVSDSGVMGRLLDVRDVVAAPFAGSRAPKESDGLASPTSPGKDLAPSSPGKGAASTDRGSKGGLNAEAIRTTANPHTAHTGLAPPREEGTHVGGTDGFTGTEVKRSDDAGAKSLGAASGRKSLDATTGRKSLDFSSGGKIIDSKNPEFTTKNSDEGKVGAPAEAGNGSAGEKESKGVSRLWSRGSRSSVDGKRRGSVDEAGGKSPNSTRRMKSPTRSRFNEEPSAGSDSNSTPASPSSSRIKVPFKDKLKGELKIISGKVSRNEAKVEQGIALKTGQTSPTHATH